MEEKEYLKSIGKNITVLRKKKKWSSQKLALECNMEKSNIIPIEKGRINVTIKTLYRIAVALEVELSELLQFD